MEVRQVWIRTTTPRGTATMPQSPIGIDPSIFGTAAARAVWGQRPTFLSAGKGCRHSAPRPSCARALPGSGQDGADAALLMDVGAPAV